MRKETGSARVTSGGATTPDDSKQQAASSGGVQPAHGPSPVAQPPDARPRLGDGPHDGGWRREAARTVGCMRAEGAGVQCGAPGQQTPGATLPEINRRGPWDAALARDSQRRSENCETRPLKTACQRNPRSACRRAHAGGRRAFCGIPLLVMCGQSAHTRACSPDCSAPAKALRAVYSAPAGFPAETRLGTLLGEGGRYRDTGPARGRNRPALALAAAS